jgi:hypothetical protein
MSNRRFIPSVTSLTSCALLHPPALENIDHELGNLREPARSYKTLRRAMLVASGTVIALPALAQQQTAPNQQMHEEADKGAKTPVRRVSLCPRAGKAGRFRSRSWAD